MMTTSRAVSIAIAATIAAPISAWAFTGVGGCSGLPEYYRALGALQGGMEDACNMSVAQAHRILQSYGSPVVADQTVAPSPRQTYRRHRAQPSQD